MKLAILAVLFVTSASPLLADTERFALQNSLDHVWTMTAAALVFFMQAGFLLLEAGAVRAKNSINVAQKNLLDFLLSTLAFGLIGFAIMFGTSFRGLAGWDFGLAFLNMTGDWNFTFFVFQLVFCGTAATIVSGAIAERMSLSGYMLITLMTGCLIYPVAGHWAWGGLLTGSEDPWLARLGFIDFAGSTLVHSVGAWIGLAAIFIIGPRQGKFDQDGGTRELHGHSPILSTVGALILWVGWVGFNGGSTTAGTPEFAHVIANTMVAGAFGGVAQFLVGRFWHGYHRPEFIINGSLGGLVAVTAGCDAIGIHGAAIIGFTGGAVAFAGREVIERMLRLDDPVGAIGVHGFAGAWGTLMTAVFAHPERLMTDTRGEQILVQLLGIGIYFAWSFGLSFLVLKAVCLLTRGPEGGNALRVSAEDELAGLNIAEHRAPLGLSNVVEAMRSIVDDPGAEVADIALDPGDESFEVGYLFNKIMGDIRHRNQAERAQSVNLTEIDDFLDRLGTCLDAYARGDFSVRIGRDGIPAALTELAESMDRMATEVDGVLGEIETSIAALGRGDLSRRLEGASDGQFARIQADINDSLIAISEVIEGLDRAVQAASAGDFSTRLSLEGREGFLRKLCDGINRIGAVATAGLDDISHVVGQVAQGNLTAQMQDGHEGAFSVIASDVNDMVAALDDVLSELETATRSVSETAETVLSQSDALIASTRDNEASVEQLSQRITALDEDTKTNDRKLAEARDNANSVRQNAEQSRIVSQQTVARMAEAGEAVERITSSLDVIGSIASQTHLLSLNASVEAARAGEQGKGFAVVAGEVRNLAAHSSETTQQISGHIASVETKVEDTAQGILETDESLGAILDWAMRNADIVEEISEIGTRTKGSIEAISGELARIKATARANHDAARLSEEMANRMQKNASEALAKLARFERRRDLPDAA